MSPLHRSPCATRRVAWCIALAALGAGSLRAQSDYSPGQAENGAAIAALNNRALDAGSGFRSSPENVPMPVFFPPNPPPLDWLVKPVLTRRSAGRPASSELAPFVNEPFYAVLAARFDRGELAERKRAALQRYHDEKNLLQHNLRTELGYILAQPPAARAPLLTALAQKMDSKILEFENRAEEFRSDLSKSGYAWDAARKPPITDTFQPSGDPEDVAHVMLGAAYFQNGLSAAQRAVLREVAIEVMSGGESVADATAAQPYVFFSPSPARVLFPELSAEAGAKFSRYQTKKSALRKELYDAVYREDATWLGAVRTMHFKSLAARQAPAFAELEQLAEEIRRELPAVPDQHATAPSVALRADLIVRVDALFQRQADEERTLNAAFEKSRAHDGELNRFTSFNPDTRRYELFRFRRPYPVSAKEFARVKPQIDALLNAYDRMDEGLTVERNAIRREIADSLQTTEPARINVALAEGARVALEQKTSGAMNDYRLAVLAPGLSPAERRLLVDAALEDLKPPLPGGVYQTRERLLQPTASNER